MRAGAATPAARRRARSRSAAVVIFTFAGVSLDITCTGCPACSASIASSVASTPARPSAIGVAEHRAAERLRRLREVDRLARQRLGDDRPPAVADPLHRVGDRNRDDRGTVRRGRVDRSRDQIRRHERPRGVVDEHDVGRAVHASKRVGDGVLPPRAALRRRARGRPPTGDPCRRRLDQGARQHDDDVGDPAWPTNASTLRSRIERPPSSSSCLGTRAPSRRPAPPAAMMAVTCMDGDPALWSNDHYIYTRRPDLEQAIRSFLIVSRKRIS